MRYAFVARERTRFPVRPLCRVLGVSVSGFHDHLHRQADPGPDPEAALRADLRTIHAGSRRTYGRPRMVKALRACAHAVGPKRVARLMREEGLRGKIKGRFKPRTTDSGHTRPVAENLLDRQFAVDSPVPAWVGDITYIPRAKAGCIWPPCSTCKPTRYSATACPSACPMTWYSKPS